VWSEIPHAVACRCVKETSMGDSIGRHRVQTVLR
jgi:hypothetical protein